MDIFGLRDVLEEKDTNLDKLKNLVSSTGGKLSLTIGGAAFFFHYLKLNLIEGSQYEKIFERIELVGYPFSLTFIGLLLTYFNYKLDLEKQKNFKQKQDMERILNSIPGSILYRDKDGIYRRCSRYFYEKFGLTSVDIVGNTLETISKGNITIPHINGERVGQDRQILGGGIEYEVRTVDGLNDNYTLVRELPLVFDDGASNGTVIFGFDITRERMLQRQLEISKNFIKEKLYFLQGIIDTLPNPLFFKSISGIVPNQYKFYNKSFCETLGLTNDPNSVISMGDVFSNQDCMNLHIGKDAILLAGTSDVITYEYDILHKGLNSVRSYLITKKLMLDSNGDIIGILGILTDRTERKILFERKELADNVLRHEIVATANTIHAGIQILEAGMVEKEEFLSFMKQPMKRMFDQTRLVRDIIDIEEGKYDLIYKDFNFIDILKEIISEFNLKQYSNPIRFYENGKEIDINHGDLDLGNYLINGDEKLFYTIFINIIKNAMEALESFSKCDESISKLPISIYYKRTIDSIKISVHNLGVIPEDIRDNFFDKFVTSGKKFGTGLGTYIIKKFTEYLGGTISFETSEKKGTTMFWKLPLNSNKLN